MNKQEELLAQILEECLEEDLSFVPPEGEIARKHRFSETFEQGMQELLEEVSHTSGDQKIRRHFMPRFGQWAACILVFCVCGWLFYHAGVLDKGYDAAAPAEGTEEAADEQPDAGTGSQDSDTTAEDAAEDRPMDITSLAGREYCGKTVYPARVQEVPERLETVTTLVNCPVLDEENPVLMLTIGNTGEEDIRYLNRHDLEVWLQDAWYLIPEASVQEDEWLTLGAGMAVDEEIDLSKYQIDYDASLYRLVTYVGQEVLSVEFTFAEVFEKTMEEAE